MRILENLRDNYFKKAFQKQKKQYKEISIAAHVPPSIPSQDNFHDCGVFLLSFAKYMVLKKDFDFDTRDMLTIRDTIRSEFENRCISTEQLRCGKKQTKRSPSKKIQQKREM